MSALDLTPTELRPRLVVAMLPHVPFEGWSASALKLAAADIGVPEPVARLAFSGPADMADAFTAVADTTMTAELERRGVLEMKVRERITAAVRVRLEQAEPHREAVRRALTVLAFDPARAAATAWRSADAMWRAAGDRATDYNFYTKRAILAGVYGSTLLVWVADESEGRAATWAFLERRIAGVMAFEKAKARLTGLDAPSLARVLGRLRYPARG